MKKECAIVQDLLVLYKDDCLQEESRKMVEDHIAECQECRWVYEASEKMQDIQVQTQTESDLQIQKSASQIMKKIKDDNIESSYRYRIDCGSYNRWTCFLQPYNG